METYFDKQSIHIGFSFIDGGFGAKIGWANVAVYICLRRFIWRKDSGELGKYYKAGKLVSCVSLTKLSKLLGIDRAAISRRLKALEKAGWLDTVGVRASCRCQIYELGRRKKVKGSMVGEIFFADALVEEAVAKEYKKFPANKILDDDK